MVSRQDCRATRIREDPQHGSFASTSGMTPNHLRVPVEDDRLAPPAESGPDAPPQFAALQPAIARTRDWLLAAPARRRLLGGRARRRHDPRERIHPAVGLSWAEHQIDAARKAARYILRRDSCPTGGWAIYPGGARRHQRQREGLLRPQAHRPRSRAPNDERPARRFWPTAAPTR